MVDSGDEVGGDSPREVLLATHKKEKKELQAEIHKMRKSSAGDRRKRKEVNEKVVNMEENLKERHRKELESLEQDKKCEGISSSVEALKVIGNESENAVQGSDSDDRGTEESKMIYMERKISKAEKKRQKKAKENQLREIRIKEEEEKSKYSARSIEVEKLNAILRERGMAMHEVKADGNCMYAAIAHQLNDFSVEDLRRTTGQFMEMHYDEFAPFLTDPETGNLLSPEEFVKYCKELEKSAVWGGQPELRALSLALKMRIEVLQAEGAPIVFGEEFDTSRCIVLTYYRHYYRVGEHYNSIVSLKCAS